MPRFPGFLSIETCENLGCLTKKPGNTKFPKGNMGKPDGNTGFQRLPERKPHKKTSSFPG